MGTRRVDVVLTVGFYEPVITKSKCNTLDQFPDRGRIVPELKAHGILSYRELIISPWRVMYRTSEQKVYVLAVIDSRRNMEDILIERFL